ncbi:Vacuolar sorting protein VPS1, dynamin [Handroanthus impetiginosus]|uniref:Vacuolar sorting protein VPS1, dynamin n=1 Tax=Handroanthus impetiginosus TaxID=429701 RepID=A0A2G9GPK7_9LAMI|nr:Vacuolar sorting protein VPS1, dynamin [Handroanthus impetiginosus]
MGSLIHAKEEIMSPKAVIHTAPMMNVLKISEEHRKDEEQSVHDAPIVSSYNDKIRPLLDTVDKLRHLKIMQEGIQLPTIVVVGDQSSGKSSVLESLAGISLPRGQGICTRVPLIMRLQNNPNPDPELFLEFNEKIIPTDEEKIADDISIATEEIAGKGKAISGNPLTLIVKKKGVPDLTMVDLPGITRVPVHGQPEDIYEQISKIIMEFITPEESIILNVLSASVDFSTCESIRMSQRVDKTGQRTLAVVTKADKSPEGLLEKVTADDVNIGLGYVCVRNRIGDESYEEARAEEANLFDNHPLLSKINKSIVGIPVLAEKLVRIQATIIRRCLPEIVRKINDKLSANVQELNKLPRHLNSIAEAMTTFLQILGSAKESLRKILVQGEFDEYPDEEDMHCTARLRVKFDKYSDELHSENVVDNDSNKNFLLDEIKVLEETKSIGLPNFLHKVVFLTLLQRKVKGISAIPLDFVEKTWNYIEDVLVSVLLRHCENYPQLISSTKRAAKNLIAKKKQQSIDWVSDVVEMENLTDYTCHPEYSTTWNKLMAYQTTLMDRVTDPYSSNILCIERFGEINIAHLRGFKGLVKEAYDVKMRITAYWDIVLRRMVDNMALHLLFSIKNLVNKEMQTGIIEELVGPQGTGLERMLEESPSVAEKRNKLKKSIKLLKESKDVVANIMDISFEDY